MKRTREQVLGEIEKFLSDGGGAHDWDDFTSIRIDDPELEKIRTFCVDLPELYPPTTMQYCNEEGMNQLRKIASELRKDVQ